MNKTLNEAVLKAVVDSGLNDYDQRSAIGIARTWVEQGNITELAVRPETRRRDDLAKELITTLELSGADETDMIIALANARAVVNAPFRREDFTGTAKLKPKEAAKAQNG